MMALMFSLSLRAMGPYMLNIMASPIPQLRQGQHGEHIAEKSAESYIFNCKHLNNGRPADELAQYVDQLQDPGSLDISCGIL